jgi:hypothetical protein
MNIAIVYKTHIWNEEIASTFEYMRKSLPNTDLYLSYNTQTCNPTIEYNKIHKYSEQTFVDRNWSYKIPGKNKDFPLMWYRGDISIVDFSVSHPQYDFVWNIDYDVTYDKWDEFVKVTSKTVNGVDFVGPLTIPHDTWDWNDQQTTSFSQLVCCYFAFVGISKRACSLLNVLYQIHSGYCEILMPTLLYNNGLNCEDIYEVYPDYYDFKHKDITPYGRYTDNIWHISRNLSDEAINQMKQWIQENCKDLDVDTLNRLDIVKTIYMRYDGSNGISISLYGRIEKKQYTHYDSNSLGQWLHDHAL